MFTLICWRSAHVDADAYACRLPDMLTIEGRHFRFCPMRRRARCGVFFSSPPPRCRSLLPAALAVAVYACYGGRVRSPAFTRHASWRQLRLQCTRRRRRAIVMPPDVYADVAALRRFADDALRRDAADGDDANADVYAMICLR